MKPWIWARDEKRSSENYPTMLRLDDSEGNDVISLQDAYEGYPEAGEELRMEITAGDAKLIAAAPVLLHALKEIRDSLEKRGIYYADFLQDAIDLAEK
jgi:hypothetical protein